MLPLHTPCELLPAHVLVDQPSCVTATEAPHHSNDILRLEVKAAQQGAAVSVRSELTYWCSSSKQYFMCLQVGVTCLNSARLH